MRTLSMGSTKVPKRYNWIIWLVGQLEPSPPVVLPGAFENAGGALLPRV